MHINVGTTINIVGKVASDPHCFVVNLLTTDDGTGIALHLSPRFDDNVVVINSKDQSTYGKEERPDRFPFARGETFIITIVATSDCFIIKVNGERLHSFRHRLPVGLVKRIGLTEQGRKGHASVHIIHISVQVI